jgi:hypothetical protein
VSPILHVAEFETFKTLAIPIETHGCALNSGYILRPHLLLSEGADVQRFHITLIPFFFISKIATNTL